MRVYVSSPIRVGTLYTTLGSYCSFCFSFDGVTLFALSLQAWALQRSHGIMGSSGSQVLRLLTSLTSHPHYSFVSSGVAGMEKTQRASVSSKGIRHPQAPLLRLGARVAAVRALVGGGTASPQDGESSPSGGTSAPRSDVATAAGVREVQVGPLPIWRQVPPQLGVEHRKEGEEGHEVKDPAAGLRVTGALGVAFYQLSMPKEGAFCGFDKRSHHKDSNGTLEYGELRLALKQVAPGLASPQPHSLPPSPAPHRPVSGACVLSKSCAHTTPAAARVVSKGSPQLLALDGVPTGSVDQCVQSIRRRRGVRLAEARPAEERWEKARKAERNRDLVQPPATLGLLSAELKTSQAELKISQIGSAQAHTHTLPSPCS